MQTTLKLVDPAQTPLARSTPLVESVEPRVLTGQFAEKLALVTHAQRELRSMGVRVLSVCWDEPIPAIRIERDPRVSLKPLLDVLGKLNFTVRGEGYDVWGILHGVAVRWSERLNFTSPVISVDLPTRQH